MYLPIAYRRFTAVAFRQDFYMRLITFTHLPALNIREWQCMCCWLC